MSDSSSTFYKIVRLLIFSFVSILILFFLGSMFLGSFFYKAISSARVNEVTSRAIAVIEVSGMLLDSKKTIELLGAAENDEEVKAIIVRINSPGGTVPPAQEIYEEIVRIDQNVKPVYASLSTVAASGAYYIASAARKIYASAGTLTGSIGVIADFYDLSKVYDYIKVAPNTLKAGKYKDSGTTSRPMNAEERKLFMELLDDVHNQFIQDILKRRKELLKEDISKLAQGQVYTGQMALKLGLIDEVKGLWQAAREIHQELAIEGKFELYFMKTRSESASYIDFFFDNIKENISEIDLKALLLKDGEVSLKAEL